MTSGNQEERSALVLLFLLLVVGLGLMFASRQARDNASTRSPEARPPSAESQGCGAGEIDLEQALAGGDLLAPDAASPEDSVPTATETAGSVNLSDVAADTDSGSEQVANRLESDRSEEPPSGQPAEAFQLPITLMLSPGVPGRGSEGRVRVLGYEHRSSNGPGVEPAFSWRSDLLPATWPLRVDAQVPSGLDLRVVYEPLGDLPAVTGAVRATFSPQGELELLYQLDRVR
jgi:hypothetical protein